MLLTFLGHSCVVLRGTKTIVIDPFVPNGFPKDIKPHAVALTHAHGDHFGAVIDLQAHTICMNELAHYLREQGLSTDPMNIGGTIVHEGVTYTMTWAAHSSWMDVEKNGTYAGGRYAGSSAGFVITMDGVTIYHAGDTGLFSDMHLIGKLYRPDIALLPIGGRYTMGPREAMMAAEFVGAKKVVPIHYNTFQSVQLSEEEIQSFKTTIERTTDLSVILLKPGESTEL
ncbi:MAG: metal-dependent hydrolase [Methanomicrobiales archaeon]|nr:metal-dependent hydrolase [Methanomicrobiales archaeon]